MKIQETEFAGLYVIEPGVYYDPRGYFFESCRQDWFASFADVHFVQDNESKSSHGVLRGLHYQLAPFSQTKLIRVTLGKIWDVVVDIRRGSPTFGRWFGIELNDENKKQLFIPKGFAHGFSVLSEHAIVSYKCDNYYHAPSESGIRYNDAKISIDWKIDLDTAIVSNKDKVWPGIDEANYNFVFSK